MARKKKDRRDVTLLDMIVDGFEKNEILDGFHWRDLPMPDESSARTKFDGFVDEATRWKGNPAVSDRENGRIARWDDLVIAQSGRGIHVRIRAPWFSDWWHDKETWADGAMDGCYDLFEPRT